MASAGNSKKTAKPRGRPFAPGQSGNPNGRPKTTPEQKDALQAIRDLAPQAAEELAKILRGEDTPIAAKIKAIEMIIERTYGKAEATVNLNDPQRDDLSDLKQMVAKFKAGGKGDG